jgi:hypothetical protein
MSDYQYPDTLPVTTQLAISKMSAASEAARRLRQTG